jgi:16S rRNA (cytosine967-C5)-methyltransferase
VISRRSAPPKGSAVIALAGRIIRAVDREHPADAVLREELRAKPRLSATEASEVSRLVFAFYRWRRWLPNGVASELELERALGLAERFAMAPQSFCDAELVANAVPAWLKEEMEVTPAWVRALQAEPKLWLRARKGQGRALADKLGDCRVFGEGPLAEILEYRGQQDLFRTPEFHAGEFELQDINSQAVGIICDAKPGETWWDACAGEGGKTLQLSDLMENKGLIWASDRAGWRLQRLKRRAARARAFNYRSALWDGGLKPPTKTRFDGVLIDAPCSGIGTWHRNPHARWTTTANDVRELGLLQMRLLSNAAGSVKPGGKLVYAVCTLTRRETVELAKNFGQQASGFEPLPIRNPLSPGAPARAETYLLPQDSGGNGMFAAAWRRT